MKTEITVPVLPESVADAVLLDWKKQVGDAVRRDEVLIEVETDKVVLEVVAPEDGVLAEILQPAGATVQANQILAVLASDAVSAPTPTPASAVASSPVAEATSVSAANPTAATPIPSLPTISPAVRQLIAEHGLDPATISGSGKYGRILKADVLGALEARKKQPPTPPKKASADAKKSASSLPTISPQIRALIAEHGLDPATISGSGKYGRILKADVLGALEARKKQPPVPSKSSTLPAQPSEAARSHAPVPTTLGGRTETREPMSRLRRTIANRLVQAQHDAALLTTFNEVNMQPVLDLRVRSRETFERIHGVRLGLMSFFVKACVSALQQYPLVNARIDGDDIVRHHYCDIGIAVASERGLVVPILRNCENLSSAAIEAQIKEFGARAAAGKLSLEELSGGTFTITNGGVFGSLLSTPILNPPQSAILGIHKTQPRPVVENGEMVVRDMMYLALTYDHRIIDGQEAVGFLVHVKEILEDPARLILA